MTETLRLHNHGRRTIQYGQNAHFKPGTSIDFPAEIGKRLQRIYPEELRSPDSNVVNYEGDKQTEKLAKVSDPLAAEKAALIQAREVLESDRALLIAEREAFAAEKAAEAASKKPASRSRIKAIKEEKAAESESQPETESTESEEVI